tara:strand:+ start:19539 stop:20939 length:1401 start_codon:yes stop_codon:yes gene_type:complete
MKTHYDVIVIGGGPAGMSGAIAASEAGLSVLLIDEQNALGGQIWRSVERNVNENSAAALGPDYLKGNKLAKRVHASTVELCLGAQVWQVEDGFKVFLSIDGEAKSLTAHAMLMATGAQERPNPFPGWTLPGVMTVGAAQILVKNAAAIPAEPVWIAGSGPLPLLYMSQLLDCGGKIAGYINTAPKHNFWRAVPFFPTALLAPKGLVKGAGWLLKLRRSGVPFYTGASCLEALGQDRLNTVRFKKANGETIEAPARLLLTHEGVVPSIHFARAMGCEMEWDNAQLCFLPKLNMWGETSLTNLFIAGDSGGIGGADAAVELGTIAGHGIALKLAAISQATAQQNAATARHRLRPLLAMRPFLDALYRPRSEIFTPTDETLVCRCECKTAGQIRAAARNGDADSTQVKAATRAGMGPCQGRQCGYTVTALIAETHKLPMGSVEFFNIRPPLKPVVLGELASLEKDGASS